MVTRIDIDLYKSKFDDYPNDLVEFAKKIDVVLPTLSSMRGQALALMAQPDVRGLKFVDRDQASTFLQKIGFNTKDAIQQFNKATGIMRLKMRGKYCLQFPFQSDKVNLTKRVGAFIKGDRDSKINDIKSWWRNNLLDIPNKDWQVGHLDPTIGDSSERNLAYQPPIQGKFRDRFKFDSLFLKMWPTASELVPKMNNYYTEKEQKVIYEALKKKFEK